MALIAREEEVAHLARTFIFQRPAEAVHEGDDRYRTLTKTGLLQAGSVQQKLVDRSLAPSDVRFSSHALRTIQTILPDGGDCHLLEALDIPQGRDGIQGLAQLSAGLEFTDPHVWLDRLGPIFTRLAARAAERMSPLLPRHGIIRVTGHAVFINFLAQQFLDDTSLTANRQLILEIPVSDGACIILRHEGMIEIIDP